MLSFNMAAQITFQKFYTMPGFYNANCGSIKQTSDGGYFLPGMLVSLPPLSDNMDGLLTRLDSAGSVIWSHSYSTPLLHDLFTYGHQTSDNGFILIGNKFFMPPTFSNSAVMMKTDSAGTPLWLKSFSTINGNSGISSFQQTNDGGFILIGSSEAILTSASSAFLVKTDSAGTFLWAKLYGSTGQCRGHSVQQTSDNGFIIAGVTDTAQLPVQYSPISLTKTDSSGNIIWTKTYGEGSYYGLNSVKQTVDGGFILAATHYNFPDADDMCLIRTDSSGNIIWSKIISRPGFDKAGSVEITPGNGYLIAGETIDTANNYHYILLMKTDSAGNTLWMKQYGATYWSEGFSASVTADNGYIISGIRGAPVTGYTQTYIIKTDANGVSGCDESSVSIPVLNYTPLVVSLPLSQSSTGSGLSLATIPLGNGILDTTLCLYTSVYKAELPLKPVTVYPNPFTGSTLISVFTDKPQKICCYITDLAGRVVKTLLNSGIPPGGYQVRWNGDNENGVESESGIYLLKIKGEDFEEVKKIIFIN